MPLSLSPGVEALTDPVSSLLCAGGPAGERPTSLSMVAAGGMFCNPDRGHTGPWTWASPYLSALPSRLRCDGHSGRSNDVCPPEASAAPTQTGPVESHGHGGSRLSVAASVRVSPSVDAVIAAPIIPLLALPAGGTDGPYGVASSDYW